MLDSSINVRRSIYLALRAVRRRPESGFLSPRYVKEARSIVRYFDGRNKGDAVIITNAVYWETMRVIDRKMIRRWADMHMISGMAGRRLRSHARYFASAGRKARHRDDGSRLSDAEGVYRKAWGDPAHTGRSEWERRKSHKKPGQEAPWDDRADMMILSTAAAIASRAPVRLFTADIGFAPFGEEIRECPGVIVMDLYDPGGWPR